jgi:ribosomal protein L11 methyltransferase
LTFRWRVLTVRVPDALDDEIAAVLGEGSLGVEVAAAGPGMSEVRVFFGTQDEAEACRSRAAHVLGAHGLPSAASGLAIDPVGDDRWVERWQASLAPIPLGAAFVVVRDDGSGVRDGREPIRLVPGMAFGTGEHPTTRLCAAALEQRVGVGSRWLDLGTGTGVLAIVAARRGASRVLAIEVDPDAARVASSVVAANGAIGAVEVRLGSIDAAGPERFDGIVANIQASFFLANAAALAKALADEGVVLASGFLDEDVSDVTSALRSAGLHAASRDSEGPWVCMAFRRDA